jgi:hypothetical protein
MSFNLIRRWLVLGASVGALVLASSASAATVRGVVVSHNTRAHSFVIAQRTGKLVSIHSRRSPALGRLVTVRVKKLLNGTFAAKHLRVRRQVRRQVMIHGVVTFVNRRHREFTVSAGGASLLIHAGRTANGTSAPLPAVGDDVNVDTQIDDQGDLNDQGSEQTGTSTDNVDVEGAILSIDNTPGTTVDGTATAGTLTISADGEDDTPQSITVAVPATMDITMFQVGQEVELTVAVQSDGSFLLQGSSEDGNSDQADNSGDQQGCQGDEDSSGTCQSGDDSDSQGDGGSTGSTSGSTTGDGGDSQGDGSSTSGSDS